MKVRLFKGLQGEEVKEVTQVILYDEHGQPLGILSSPAPGVITTSFLGDENFQASLQDLVVTSDEELSMPEVIKKRL